MRSRDSHNESPEPFALLITGPAGAGKTTTAQAWASAWPHPAAHVSLDDVRFNIKSGRVDPADGWSSETERQYEIARAACASLTRLYAGHGLKCAIDDAIFPSWPEVSYGPWRAALGNLPHTVVILLPRFDKIVERNLQRFDHAPLPADMLRTIYDMMMPWESQNSFPVIDNSDLSLEETVDTIDKVIIGQFGPRRT